MPCFVSSHVTKGSPDLPAFVVARPPPGRYDEPLYLLLPISCYTSQDLVFQTPALTTTYAKYPQCHILVSRTILGPVWWHYIKPRRQQLQPPHLV